MKRQASKLWILAATLLVAGVRAAFWGAGLRRTGGAFPVPLDDVYIHFGFARAAALGHPFSWIPGNGYSSGGTSLVYPLLLAPAWLLGFRGAHLAIFAAILAVACVVDLARSIRALLAPAPAWVQALAPALVLAVPLVDWSLFSGMETALFAAILGRALVAVERSAAAPPLHRARADPRRRLVRAPHRLAARVGAARAAARPRLGARGALPRARAFARSRARPVAALSRRPGRREPRAHGGDRSGGRGAQAPRIQPVHHAARGRGEVIKNLVALREQALSSALGGPRLSWILPLLGLAAVLDRRARRLALPLLLGAYAALLLVSLNATARFQNLRYAVPTLLMLLAAAALGVGSLARRRRLAPLAALALAGALIAPARWFPRQIDHFARASGNIEEQQAEVARRLAAMRPRPRRVLVGDAGAIPYLSGLDAIDGLGLGGYHGLPFARASVHGNAAVVELIERLPKDERPDVLALYPSWWKGLADVFGARSFGVRIQDNVICAADEKVVYTADWSSLADPGEARPSAVDELDVADLVDERAHRYEIPAPRGGWVIGAVLADATGKPRFDAGRIVPEGRRDAFVIAAAVPRARAALIFRTSGGGPGLLRVEVERSGTIVSSREVAIPERATDRWSEIRADVETIGGGDRVIVHAERSAFSSFHVWLMRD